MELIGGAQVTVLQWSSPSRSGSTTLDPVEGGVGAVSTFLDPGSGGFQGNVQYTPKIHNPLSFQPVAGWLFSNLPTG
jgi:hypothetical protein